MDGVCGGPVDVMVSNGDSNIPGWMSEVVTQCKRQKSRSQNGFMADDQDQSRVVQITILSHRWFYTSRRYTLLVAATERRKKAGTTCEASDIYPSLHYVNLSDDRRNDKRSGIAVPISRE